MNGQRRMIALVARREVRSRLRSRAMKVSTAIFVVAILVIGIVNRATRHDAAPRTAVATVGDVPAGFTAALEGVATALHREVSVAPPLPDRQAADTALRGRDVDVVVDATSHEMAFRSTVDDTTAAMVAAAWRESAAAQAATRLGLAPAAVAAVTAPQALSTTTVEHTRDRGVGTLVGMLSAILLFICLNTFGALVLTGVVEEKTSAVIEILLAQVRAHVLLAGKVIGIGIVALVQFAVLVVVGVVSLRISGTAVPTEVWVALPTTIGWFLGGFALYATLFALAGSFVSRQEDAQSAAAPISLIFTAGYVVVFVVAGNPGATLPTVLSVLPPFAPLLMPLRIATGVAVWWQVVLAVVLLVAAVVGVLRGAGATYSRTLLYRGSRITWREALRPTERV